MSTRTQVTMNLKELAELEERWSELSDLTVSDTAAAERLAINGAQILVGEIRKVTMALKMGELARSYREKASVSDGRFRMGAFSDLVYARIQDEGGKIVPRTRKSLAIPMTKKAKARWPRDWPRDKLFRPKGKDWLGMTKGKKGKVEVQYLLRKSVTIKPKHYIRDATKVAVPQITDLFIGFLLDRLAGKKGDTDG